MYYSESSARLRKREYVKIVRKRESQSSKRTYEKNRVKVGVSYYDLQRFDEICSLRRKIKNYFRGMNASKKKCMLGVLY